MIQKKSETAGEECQLKLLARRSYLSVALLLGLLAQAGGVASLFAAEFSALKEASPSAVPMSGGTNSIRFNVQTYVVDANPPLPTRFPQFLSRYTGESIPLEDILQAASTLQAEYRKLGYPMIVIAVGQEEITNHQVILHVAQGAISQILFAGRRYPVPPVEVVAQNPSLKNSGAPTNNSMVNEIRGKSAVPAAPGSSTSVAVTVTPPAVVESSPALEQPRAGLILGTPVSPEALAKAEEALHREIIALDRRERRALMLSPPTNSAVAAKGPFFDVKGYEVNGNTLLSQDVLDLIFEPYTVTNATFETIRHALVDLQLVYRERGYPTVSVTLPQQTLSNGIVKVNVFQGRLSEIYVANSHYFSSNNVMRALPSLRTNVILTTPVFQAELDRANANQDRQIYPQIEPGPEENTTSLRLQVKDRLPLHAKLELDNQSSPGTPELRLNSSAVYNNLWQHEHSLGLQYSFSPEAFKSGKDWDFYDQPLVANYSVFYRMPLGNPESISDAVAARPGTFGYDEATRRFHLPPPSGQPELNVYASRSAIDTGGMTTFSGFIYSTNDSSLFRRDVQQDLTENNAVGARLTVPMPEAENPATLSGGFDFKTYNLVSYKTNLLILTEVTTLPEGLVTNVFPDQVTSTNSHHLEYLPLTFRYDATWRGEHGNTSFGMGLSGNVWYSGSVSNLHQITGSSRSHGHWLTLNPSFTRDFIFHTNWTLSLHAEAQWANEPLISNEQFGIGGVANVRGYREGEAFGDEGWRVNVDLKTPPHIVGTVYGKEALVVRGGLFMDYAEAYLIDPNGRDSRIPLWGTGAGMVLSVGPHWDARLLFSLPLSRTIGTQPYQPRFNFALTGQF